MQLVVIVSGRSMPASCSAMSGPARLERVQTEKVNFNTVERELNSGDATTACRGKRTHLLP